MASLQRRSLAVLVTVVQFALAQAAVAQIVPMGGWGYAVEVTPDGSTTPDRAPYSGPHTETFTVRNSGSYSDTYTLTCTSSSNVTCTQLSQYSVSLAPYKTRKIYATYTVGSVGTGTLTLRARSTTEETVTDVGYFNVPVVASSQGPPIVALRNHNGDHLDRSLCLNINAESHGAVRCGDLLVAHGLPAYRTLGRDRSLTLVYNSGTANPTPVVAVAVTVPAGLGVPDSVYAELQVQGAKRASGTYTSWAAGQTRQISLGYSASSDTTGAYPFTIIVRSHYPGATYDTTATDTLLVVNRSASEFGAGWFLAGVEQFKFVPGNRLLWLGGDGSAIIYRAAGANKWAASPGTYQDTITWTGSTYVRGLRHGVTVTFDQYRHHTLTTTRTGQITTFTWDGSGRLAAVQVPPSGASGTTYTLTYTPSDTVLDRVTDPAGRQLDVTISGGDLTAATDPDGGQWTYVYSGRRMTRQRDQGGVFWDYGYAWAHVSWFRNPVSCGACEYEWTRLYPWDQLGLAFGVTSGMLSAVDTAVARTKVDGPRWYAVADTTLFWVDRFGAPTKIVNPLGHTTTITRGEGGNPPALATRVVYPNGRIMRASYDGRANVRYVYDDTHEGTNTVQTVQTRYDYNDPGDLDSPSAIRAPVDTTLIAYHASLGLPTRISDQAGHVTRFTYEPSGPLTGLLVSVMDSAVPVVDTVSWTKNTANLVTTLQYDGWGNDTANVSPSGLRMRFLRDGVRRVYQTFDPALHLTEYSYDAMNRIQTVMTFAGPPSYGSPDTTWFYYSATGHVDSVSDPRGVKRRWTYDGGGRPIQMIDEAGAVEMRRFNLAGMVDTVWLRTGDMVRHTFDAAGRNVQTVAPSRVVFGVPIPGVTITRQFDALNRITYASAAHGSVTRTYNREGTLKDERQVVTGALDFTARYRYDVGNRRTWFNNGIDTVTYLYGTNGYLDKLKVWWASGFQPDSFQFRWDGLGRRDSVIYTNGARVGFGYDRESQLRIVCSVHHSGAWDGRLNQRLRYRSMDPDGHVLNMEHWAGGPPADNNCALTPTGAAQLDDIDSASYDSRHQLTGRYGTLDWIYNYDRSGNMILKRMIGDAATTFTMPSLSNRVAEEEHDGFTFDFNYDANGSRIERIPESLQQGWERYYYNAVGQMTGMGKLTPGGNNSWYWDDMPDLCWYDALGRRVKQCDPASWAPKTGFDGDNVVRSAGEAYYWRYVHGPGTDDPLVAVHTGTQSTRYYYLTDGRGRQMAFTDWDGNDYTTYDIYSQTGGNQAGGITQSHGFEHERGNSPEVPQLSFYRNRYYDQQTGRFMQEDPIGIAGGVNLYQYGGNNPVSHTDPFGLCPEPPGSCLALFTGTGALIGAQAGLGLSLASGGVVSPITVTGGAAVGATLGFLTGVVVEGRNAMGRLRKVLGTILIGVGAAGPLIDVDKDGEADVSPGIPAEVSDPTQTGAGGGTTEEATVKERKPPASKGDSARSQREPKKRDR